MSNVDAVIEAQQLRVGTDPTPVEFLRAVYCYEAVPLSVRLRAAIEAAPYVHPKLSATAILEAGDLAERLERAIERSHSVVSNQTTKVIPTVPAPD